MTKIWFYDDPSLDALNTLSNNNMVGHLGIEFIEIGDDFLKAQMPIDHRTTQPLGLLHGGASVSLAETMGSVGATLCIDPADKICVGLEINANHVRSARQGLVIGTARPMHIGSTTQIWEIQIHDATEKLVCISRITMAVLDKR